MEGFPDDDPNLIRPYLTSNHIVIPLHLPSEKKLLDLLEEFCNSYFIANPDDARLLEIQEARYGRMVRFIITRTWKCEEIAHIFGQKMKRGPKKRYKTKGLLL